MEPWLIWISSGAVLIVAELILPGAIVIFLGLAALIVGLGIKLGYISDMNTSFVTFSIVSLILLVGLRSIFMKYFEGDSTVQNVDENADAKGSIVEVAEDIQPFREGRVHFRGSSWQARSDSEILKGEKAIVMEMTGNIIIVKPL